MSRFSPPVQPVSSSSLPFTCQNQENTVEMLVDQIRENDVGKKDRQPCLYFIFRVVLVPMQSFYGGAIRLKGSRDPV